MLESYSKAEWEEIKWRESILIRKIFLTWKSELNPSSRQRSPCSLFWTFTTWQMEVMETKTVLCHGNGPGNPWQLGNWEFEQQQEVIRVLGFTVWVLIWLGVSLPAALSIISFSCPWFSISCLEVMGWTEDFCWFQLSVSGTAVSALWILHQCIWQSRKKRGRSELGSR